MSQLKTNYAVSSRYEAFYTGGKIQVSKDGSYMFCGCGNKVNILEVATGKVHISIGEEQEEEISSFCLTPNDEYVILATQNLLLRQWEWREKKLVRSWKAIHFAPVVSMTFDITSTLLATGSADSTVKVWDIDKQYCTHNLRGHQGIISVVAFHPDISRLLMYSAGEDYKIRVWNLSNSKCVAEIPAHYSLVTCIAFSKDGTCAYTSGRDGVVSIIDTSSNIVRKTLPVFEVVESVVLLPEKCDNPDINVTASSVHFVTAGNKGTLRVWNSHTGKCVFTTDAIHSKNQFVQKSSAPKPESDDSQNIVQMVYNQTANNITVVTYDQNISVLSLDKLRLQKQFAGNNDEILDMKYFGEDENYAIVATNSMLIKVFELRNWDCEILYGHTDIVMCIDVIPKSDMFISGGKDNTVRLWKMNPVLKQVSCLAVGQGHTSAVGAVAMSRTTEKFFVSGSEDCTLKLWQLPDDLDPSVTMEIHAAVTERAHDKTISSITVAPNDKFIATGSMDKTAKLWKAGDLSLVGVMRGHKRGIWCVQFSPVDQVLATSSGDGTVKLWSLSDFSCVRTFEGHDCAVLRVAFISRGMQLLSSGTNGLVKLWTIKNNECVKTLDAHEDKVWALAVGKSGDNFLTGAADSSLIIWKDVTEIEQNEAREKQEKFILQDQELSNLIQQKKYLKALGLAITLEQPFRLLNILKEILSQEEGEVKLYQTLEKLRLDQIDALMRFSVEWNTNSRHCHEAQVVLASLMKMYPPKQLREMGNLKSSVEGLLPYTERHLNRISRLVQQSMFLEYTWQCMRGLYSQTEEGSEVLPVGSSTRDPSFPEDMDVSSSESDGMSTARESQPGAHFSTRLSQRKGSKLSHEDDSSPESEESSESEMETNFVIDRKGNNSKPEKKMELLNKFNVKSSQLQTGSAGNESKPLNKSKKQIVSSECETESSDPGDGETQSDVKLHSVDLCQKDSVQNVEESDESSDSEENFDDVKRKKESMKIADRHHEDPEDSSESEESSESEPNVSKKCGSVSSTSSEREILRHAGRSEKSVKTIHLDSSVFNDTDLKSGSSVSGKVTSRGTEHVARRRKSEKPRKGGSEDSDLSVESGPEMIDESAGVGDLVTPVLDIPSGKFDTDQVTKKLFQSLLTEKKPKTKKGSGNAPKRKLMENYTVVKKTPQVIGLDYIDGKHGEQLTKADMKQRPRDHLAASKLKKLKRPKRR